MPDGSGEAVSSFRCGEAEALAGLGQDPREDWDSYEEGAVTEDGVEVWDRSDDALTCILGRGNDLDSVSEAFFGTLRNNFSGHLGI